MKAVAPRPRPALEKLARWFHRDGLLRFADARSAAAAYVDELGPSQRKVLRDELIDFLACHEGAKEKVLRQEMTTLGARSWPSRGIRSTLVAVLIMASKSPRISSS